MTQAKIGRGVQITFLGHSAFKLTGAGVNVLIDPWLTNPLLNTPVDKVGPVDLILVTHGHGDHVGETVAVAQKTGAPVVAIHELCVILARQGAPQVIGMNKGGTLTVAGCKVTMTQAVHSSAVDEGGELIAAGDPAGFVVEFRQRLRGLPRRRHRGLQGHGTHPGALPSGAGHAPHRQPLRHEPGRGGPGLPDAQAPLGHPHALRHLPGAHRHARGIDRAPAKGSRTSRSFP